MIKRKTHQTFWELESMYYRACRITGTQPNLIAYQNLDAKQAIVILKRELVKTILSI